MPRMCVKRTQPSSTMCVHGARKLADSQEVLPMVQSMHTHLRAWRKNRKMTLEVVASHLGVRHTTVSRWEAGSVRISGADLERLASLYQASITQLVASPSAAALVHSLDRFQTVIDRMSTEQVESVLTFLESTHTRPQ